MEEGTTSWRGRSCRCLYHATGRPRKTSDAQKRTYPLLLKLFNRNAFGSSRGPALDLDVLGRSLATVGDLFVLDRLALIEGRKTSLLHCRDMNEHVFAARRGLDEPVPLGRVEPLDRTF